MAAGALGALVPTHLSMTGPAAQPAAVLEAPCVAWAITYSLAGTVRIMDTPMGAGDGVYPVGPGSLVLRFDDHEGSPGGRARMVSFELREQFALTPRAVLWYARLETDVAVRATPDESGVAGEGLLTDDMLRWDGPIRGYRADGALTCEGSLCGKFGAPPQGRTPLHVAPTTVLFQPLTFGREASSFQMPFTLVSESQSPRQRTFLAMAGRETAREHVQSTCP
jgi:hypothetical protein